MLIVSQIKESWSDILANYGWKPNTNQFYLEDPDYPEANNGIFTLLANGPTNSHTSLIFQTSWSNFTYHFFTRKNVNYVLYNGGRDGWMAQNILPSFTIIGEPKSIDIDEIMSI